VQNHMLIEVGKWSVF